MRIAIFTRCLHNGGTERVIAKLSRIWSAQGHEIVFLTQLQRLDAEFAHECVARECADGGVWRTDDVNQLKEKYNFDLVVFNGGWNDAWVSPVLCRFNELKVRTMVILHHAFNNWAFSGANAGDFDKDRLLSRLDCLVCVDRMQALWWSRRHPCVAYVPNPCGVEEDEVDAETVKAKRNHIVWVGRVSDWGKRVNLAIEVFREVRKKVADVRMTVVGALPKDWKCDDPCIKFTGYVQNASNYIKSATVHLVTTLWEVTVPQVVMESRALGVPTVAFDLPVFRDVNDVYLGKNIVEVSELLLEILAKPGSYRKDNDVNYLFKCNKNVEERWNDLFAAFESGDIETYLKNKSLEYTSVDHYAKLMDEIQRSEAFVVANSLSDLNKVRCWRSRWEHLKRLLLGSH